MIDLRRIDTVEDEDIGWVGEYTEDGLRGHNESIGQHFCMECGKLIEAELVKKDTVTFSADKENKKYVIQFEAVEVKRRYGRTSKMGHFARSEQIGYICKDCWEEVGCEEE